jgi:hypothetical protein
MPLYPDRWKNLLNRYREDRPRRMLALDGGGIRGLISHRELMDLVPRTLQYGITLQESFAAPRIPIEQDLGRNFLYPRYNADLSRSGLDAPGFQDVDPDNIQKMDCPDNIPMLLSIGQAASAEVLPEHFGSFL